MMHNLISNYIRICNCYEFKVPGIKNIRPFIPEACVFPTCYTYSFIRSNKPTTAIGCYSNLSFICSDSRTITKIKFD